VSSSSQVPTVDDVPELVLAEEGLEAAVGALGQVEVDGGLLRQVVVGEHEQAERAEKAPPRRAGAGAAVESHVGLRHALHGRRVHLEHGLNVQLRQCTVHDQLEKRTIKTAMA
jgi:hypothetical protein